MNASSFCSCNGERTRSLAGARTSADHLVADFVHECGLSLFQHICERFPTEDPDEIWQSTIVELWDRLNNGRLLRLAKKIAHDCGCDEWRLNHQRIVQLEEPTLVAEVGDPCNGLDDEDERSVRKQRVAQSWARLPIEERVVLRVFIENDYNFTETAKALQRNPGTVNHWIHRVLDKLKDDSLGG
jgi:DNA-directed RNA polymerase specialized sigma24 family protein